MPNQDTPMPFKNLIGHRSIVGLLARAISRDSLPPSLIFAGPAGVGKRTAATALAQALNCPNVGSLARSGRVARQGRQRACAAGGGHVAVDPVVAAIDACGECVVCRRIAQGTYSDVLVLEPEDTGNIKVEQVRDAIERTAYRPVRRPAARGDRRRSRGDERSRAERAAEAARRAASLLVVRARHRRIRMRCCPTVRSRCTMLRFGRLSADEVARVLVATGRVDEKNARALAAIADGSPGVALGWKDQGFEDARDAAERVLQRCCRGAPTSAGGSSTPNRCSGKKSSRSSERDQTALRLQSIRVVGARSAGAFVGRRRAVARERRSCTRD